MGERVHERCNEFGGTGASAAVESYVGNTACLVQVAAAVRICLGRRCPALLGKVDAPRESRTDERESGASQGRLRWSPDHQEYGCGEAEKRSGPVGAERRDDHSHDTQG